MFTEMNKLRYKDLCNHKYILSFAS